MSDSRRDWSEKDLRRIIVEQRKFLWRSETIRHIADNLRMGRKLSFADIGCGLGYLGWTFWEHCGKEPVYVGVDCSLDLLRDATKLSGDWSGKGQAFFIRGSAYGIPVHDDQFDITMCQTLLMHLARPEDALSEMIRITRPGGAIMCMEPDNVSSSLCVPFSSLPEKTIHDLLNMFKAQIIWARGRKKLGKGDWSIGARLPKLMADAGLVRIEARPNDKSMFVQPPYESGYQKHFIEQSMRNIQERDEKEEAMYRKEWRDCYMAGGGSRSSYYRLRKYMDNRRSEVEPVILEQMKSGRYYHGFSGSAFMCVTGFKPT